MKKPGNLSDPHVLLTEAGEAQWLDQLLDEAAVQKQRDQQQALAMTVRQPTSRKHPRKAA